MVKNFFTLTFFPIYLGPDLPEENPFSIIEKKWRPFKKIIVFCSKFLLSSCPDTSVWNCSKIFLENFENFIWNGLFQIEKIVKLRHSKSIFKVFPSTD